MCPRQAKLGRLLFNAGDAHAAPALRAAAAALRVCFGGEHEEVRELERLHRLCAGPAADASSS